MNIECIIKLGGSAITEKDSFETYNLAAIQQAAKIISEIKGRCVLVHGAGSFGHFQAKEYKVSNGYCANLDKDYIENVKHGFCHTRISVTKLNHLVTSEFNSLGIPAVGISTCGSWKTENKHVIKSDIESVLSLLDGGFLPILHGDCVIDSKLGCTILSGDTIIETLCQKCNPKRVIFLTDVEGIYDKPPVNDDAKLLPWVNISKDGGFTAPIATSSKMHDTTGGIAFKLKNIISIITRSEGKIPVFICKIDSESAKHACFHGNLLTDSGTLITMKDVLPNKQS